jgi:thiol-disulfide isomerase/thioredoxin
MSCSAHSAISKIFQRPSQKTEDDFMLTIKPYFKSSNSQFVLRLINRVRPRPSPSCHGKAFFRFITISLLLLSPHWAMAVAEGGVMPPCQLSPIGESQSTDISQYKGKVLYVDFWASWCGPCAKSFPFLNEMHQQLKDQGLQIVGINLDENADDAKAFLAKYPASFDIKADVSKQCAKDFEVKAMPSSYIIDRNGKVHHVHLGFRPGEAKDLRVLVEKLLSEKVAGL